MARAREEIREQRITMEAIVDAYGSSERAMGWYYYLDGKMKVPFKARCRLARPISVLKVKEEVEVLGMAPEEECESEMFVWVGRAGERIAAPWRNCDPCRKIKRPRRLLLEAARSNEASEVAVDAWGTQQS
jgi:Calcium binding